MMPKEFIIKQNGVLTHQLLFSLQNCPKRITYLCYFVRYDNTPYSESKIQKGVKLQDEKLDLSCETKHLSDYALTIN